MNKLKIKKLPKQYVIKALVAALLVSTQQVSAQNKENKFDALEEVIVVTSRLIEENAQDIPLSVTAIDADEIQKRGIDSLTEIARNTANFSFENFNGAISTPVIRGQSQNRLTNPIQNVATFYNGVYIQRGYMIDASLLNIGQVEIVRGPQVAAFGRNAFAGAISYRNKDIGDEVAGFISVAAGENEFQRLELTGELPITDTFGLTAGYSSTEYDGAWENNHALADAPGARTSGNLGGWESEIFHVGAKLDVGDIVTLKANYIKSERELENTAQHALSANSLNDPAANTLNCSPIAPFPGAPAANAIFCGTIPVEAIAVNGRKEGLVVDPRSGVELESEIFSVEAAIYLTDTLQLNLTYGQTEGIFDGAGSSNYDHEIGYDGAFAPVLGLGGRLLIDTSGNGNIETNSYEARLTFEGDSKLTAYAGLYYSDTDDVTDFALISLPAQTTGPLDPGIELNVPGFAANSLATQEVTSIYGFVKYEASEQFTISAELRYTEEEISETDRFNPAAITSNSQDFDYLTPKIAGTYFLSEDSNVYLSYAEGVKAGGFNTGGSNPSNFVNQNQATYDEETNKTIELGSKNILFGGDLTLNATLFYIESEDLQVNEPREGANGNIIANRAEAETLGLEFEALFTVTDNLDLNLGLGYVNAEYGNGVIDSSNNSRCDDIVCPTNGDIGGNQIERAPSTTINAGFTWEAPLTNSMDYYVVANVGYQDEFYVNSINTAEVESRAIVDTTVGVNMDNGIEIKLSVDNLFDEEYVSNSFEVGFLSTYVPNLGDRRRAVLTASYRF